MDAVARQFEVAAIIVCLVALYCVFGCLAAQQLLGIRVPLRTTLGAHCVPASCLPLCAGHLDF